MFSDNNANGDGRIEGIADNVSRNNKIYQVCVYILMTIFFVDCFQHFIRSSLLQVFLCVQLSKKLYVV